MKSEFESREAFECIFGDEGEIDLSKDETGEYSFQPSRFAYSFFFVAWQYRQTEVDELELQVAEMKSRLNDAYTDGQSAMYTARQSKVDELQEKLDASEKTRSTLYEENVDLRAKNDELQKRVNACQKLLEKWKTTGLNGTSDYAVGGAHARQNCEDELEQALKGGGE